MDTDGDDKISVGDQIRSSFGAEITTLDDGRQAVGEALGLGVVDAGLLKELGVTKNR